jgi:undecaprenyl-diphosphatase
MSAFEAVVLGIVQGLTEFLPISSTAHLRIVPALLGWGDPGAAYSAVIQLGTVGAVLVYFAKDLAKLTRAFLGGLAGFLLNDRSAAGGLVPHAHATLLGTLDSRMAWFVGLGTIPIGVFGLLFKKTIETSLRSLYVISASLILLAVVLLIVERVASHARTLEQMTLKDALIVGAWQAVALIPGSSRSGTTITGALSLGLTRADAARYSFLLSIPATTLAGVFELKHLLKAKDGPGVDLLLIGSGVSFVTGLLAIWGLLKFLRSQSTLVFVVYRVVLGLALIGLVRGGFVQASPSASLAECKEWKATSSFARASTCPAGMLSYGDYQPVAGESFSRSAIDAMKVTSPSVVYAPPSSIKLAVGGVEREAVLLIGRSVGGTLDMRALVLEDVRRAGVESVRGAVCSRLAPVPPDDAECVDALARMLALPALGGK